MILGKPRNPGGGVHCGYSTTDLFHKLKDVIDLRLQWYITQREPSSIIWTKVNCFVLYLNPIVDEGEPGLLIRGRYLNESATVVNKQPINVPEHTGIL